MCVVPAVSTERVVDVGASVAAAADEPAIAALVAGVNGLPTVSVLDVVLSERMRKNTSTASILVSLSSPSSSKVTVAYQTQDVTASAAACDYVAAQGTLTIKPGATSGRLKVKIRRDAAPEADEVFNVLLTGVVNATAESNAPGGLFSRVVIRDDDTIGLTRPVLSVSSSSVPEGDVAAFIVTLSAAATQDTSVRYFTEPGTASDTQFTPVSDILTIPAGQTSAMITVLTSQDSTVDGNQQFLVKLSAPANADLASDTAAATIVDDEPLPTLSVSDVAVSEGNAGTASLTFTVTLSSASTSIVTVAYATADDTATAGSDYLAATGTLTFAPGKTAKTVDVTVNGDTTFEPDEAFDLTLSNPANATLASATAAGTITNDDSTPAIAVTGFAAAEGNSSTTTADFTVTLSAASSLPVTVDFATAAGSATAGSDYQAATGTLTFAPGERSKLVAVTIIGDTADESNETITLNLSNPVNVILLTDAAIETILDDDTSSPITLT